MNRQRTPSSWILASLALAVGMGGCESGDRSFDVSYGEFGEFGTSEPAGVTPDIVSIEPWTFAGRAGYVIRTPHYRIYTTESTKRLREGMAVFLEYAIAHYRTALTPLPAPPQKLDTYLMDNRDQWETLSKRLLGARAEELENIQRGGYATRGIGVYYDLGIYDTLAIAAHEGWHQYTQRTFGDPLPIWLEEGMAVYMEGHRQQNGSPKFLPWANTERFDRLQDAVNADRIIPLERLLGMKPQDHLASADENLLDFYAHVWALTQFLAEGEDARYLPRLRLALSDAAHGRLRETMVAGLGPEEGVAALASRVGPELFRIYFNDDLEAAGREYERFVRDVARLGARQAIVGGHSPMR